MSTTPPYVSEAGTDSIVVHCSDTATGHFLEHFGFTVEGDVYTLAVSELKKRAHIFGKLRDNGLCFAAGVDNDPCTAFESLRKKKLISGPFKEITWGKNKKWKIREREK